VGERGADRGSGGEIGLSAERFITHSRVMRALADQIRRFARADSNVLIAGETGTGKNAVARELHARGPRARRPFVIIDCASLSPSLIDSELFGHERGAFTDAVATRAGRFELAGNGTVYLDAVPELSVEDQGKLLRIVEEKRVERLGGHTAVAVGARIVASTGADIADGVRLGTFRHDLYHRLRVLPLFIPPLRERREDVAPLVRYFLTRAAAAVGRTVPAISRDASAALGNYAWPGNVRELRHAVDRAYQASDGGTITLDHLPPDILEVPLQPTPASAQRPTLEDVERRYIAATLRDVGGNQTEAARILGISRKALWEKRQRYGLA
jgi:DNA-binding NtrC family response regulator